MFYEKVRELALADGYKISFPSLHGGDQFDSFTRDIGWGTGSVVTSDLARPLKLIENGEKFPMCGRLRQVRATPTVSWDHEGTPPSCWPCKKFRTVCPEYFSREVQNGKYTGPHREDYVDTIRYRHGRGYIPLV
ncbi:hypothetical protein CC86DRAFT_385620 [Ophiobolus disseminans]|uniref:Uncharacterized protein n=1 Tax=Ophiobolus disseminans TaxID=1469910 RepID=A0A6A6ZNP1_9PLEO|nr:hypothetical protein CC86DRAFT_385620 [Ophiobolus disseminans]